MRTRSPVFAEFSSSCAFTFFVRVTIFPYTGWATRRSIATTTVFCILSLTTSPVRVFRIARAGASFVAAPVAGAPFRVVSAIGLSLLRGLLLAQNGLEARQVAANHA